MSQLTIYSGHEQQSRPEPVVPEAYIGTECPHEPRRYQGIETPERQHAWPQKTFTAEEVFAAYALICTSLTRGMSSNKATKTAKQVLQMAKRSDLPPDAPEVYERIRGNMTSVTRLATANKKAKMQFGAEEANMLLRYFVHSSEQTCNPVNLVLVSLSSQIVADQYGSKAKENAITTGIDAISKSIESITGTIVMAKLRADKENTPDVAVVTYGISPGVIQECMTHAIQELTFSALFPTISGEKGYDAVGAVIITHEPSVQSLEGVLQCFEREIRDISKNTKQGVTTRKLAA